jgi:hypothetical protein
MAATIRGVEPVTINSRLLFSYVTVDQAGVNAWQERYRVSEYARETRIDYIYVLFRELAARRFTYTPDSAEIENFVGSPKPLLDAGVVSRADAALLIRFALGEDGLVGHLSLDERAVVELRLSVYLYREIVMSEEALNTLLVQIERAVAEDYPELKPE